MSDMNGKKSEFFSNFCKKNNYSFLTFDFRGHGKSSGEFTDYGIGDWYGDLKKIFIHLNLKESTIIGSSMGGWIAMLFALKNPKKVSKLIGIAPAPDFTIDLLWKNFNSKERENIKLGKIIKKKIDRNFYYHYSPKLFINSKKFLIKNIKNRFSGETILFHGSKDYSVPYSYNDRFYKNSNFLKLINITIKDADHSLSDKFSLSTILKYI